MKKKTTKFSLGFKIVSILACLTLVSVGFASWWIIKPPAQQTAEGSFEVYAVSTKNIAISAPTFEDVTLDLNGADQTVSSSKIIFGKADFPTDATNHKWLLVGADVYDENLTATMNFNVSVKDGSSDTSTTNLAELLESVKLTMVIPTNLKTAITNGYITSKIAYTTTNGTTKQGEVAIDGTKDSVELVIDMSGAVGVGDAIVNSVDVEVTFEFDWGTKFHGENPYTYFNKSAYTETLAAEAADVLGTLTNLNASTYSVTLEGVLAD